MIVHENTIGKTVKSNQNLVKTDSKHLLDTSNIKESFKEEIIKKFEKYPSITHNNDYELFANRDKFDMEILEIVWGRYGVYKSDGKRLYSIYYPKQTKYSRFERKSIYNEFDLIEQEVNKCQLESEDIELQ